VSGRSGIINAGPPAALSVSSSRSVLRVWSLALALSAVLAAAAERWPEPLPILSAVVWGLVLLPPLAMALVLLAGWSLPSPSPGQGGESEDSDREKN
jgi:hypothetical protein